MIKKLDEQWIDGMAHIENVCFETEAWNEEMIKGMFCDPMSRVYGCFEGEFLIGYCAYGLRYDEGHIYNIAVLPAFRRRGYGALMVKHMIEEGEKEGIWRFTLEVRVENMAAITLYERYGFKGVGVRPNYYGTGHHALIMWKN